MESGDSQRVRVDPQRDSAELSGGSATSCGGSNPLTPRQIQPWSHPTIQRLLIKPRTFGATSGDLRVASLCKLPPFLVIVLLSVGWSRSPCTSDPCQHLGTCVLVRDSSNKRTYMCLCVDNYSGPNCESGTQLTAPCM